MRDDLILKLSTLIETIPGFGLWTEQHDEALLLGLSDVPDRVYDPLRREVLKRFKTRPSVAELRDLAKALLPVAEYAPGLPAPSQPDSPVAGKPPAHVRAVFDRLKAMSRKSGGMGPGSVSLDLAGDWGLEYDYGGGQVKRTPARHCQAEAERRAAENGAKYTHFQVRVYHKSSRPAERGADIAERGADIFAGIALAPEGGVRAAEATSR